MSFVDFKKNVLFVLVFVFLFNVVFSQDKKTNMDELNSKKEEITIKLDELNKTHQFNLNEIKNIDQTISKEKDNKKKSELEKKKSDLIKENEKLVADIKSLETNLKEIELSINRIKEESKKEENLNAQDLKQKELDRLQKQKAYIEDKIKKQKDEELAIKKKKEEEKKKLSENLKKNSVELKQKKEQLAKITKEINLTIDNIIKSLKKEDIEKYKTTKSELMYKKALLEKEITDINIANLEIQQKLKIKDDGFVDAQGTLNWNKTYDIETIQRNKPGTWSITVVAKDSMNNLSEEEAINVIVDPKSDIPYLNIINPKPNQRVPGNLMIVGTAFDDDEVGRVVLFVDNEKKERLCNGKEFWFYDLDTSIYEDGLHKLTFKVYDIKGVPSKEYYINFLLDRKIPLLNVTTINSGSVVSGKKKIGGTSQDMNGIVSIEYSIDDRNTFTKVSFKNNAPNGTKVSWAFDLDTNTLPSGTQVIWIRAKDKAGSEGLFPLTLIVDREKPNIIIDYPKNNQKLGDRFTIYGQARDNVDIAEVTIQLEMDGFNKQEWPVKILPGNPLWKFDVDVSKMGDSKKLKDGKAIITAKVKDVAGNIIYKKTNININLESEKPVVKLKSVNKGDSFANEIPIYGPISDDDEPKEVIFNLLDSKGKSVLTSIIPSRFSFSRTVDVKDVSEGEYSVEVTPSDFFVKGNTVKEKIWIDRSAPLFDISKINKNFAGKLITGKLNLDFSVTKYGEMPKVEYFVIENDGIKIIEKGEIKLKQGKDPGVFDVNPVVIDFTKDKKLTGLKVVKLVATDRGSKKSEVQIPIFVDQNAPIVTDVKFDEKVGVMKDITVKISDDQIIKDIEITVKASNKEKPDLIKLNPGDTKEFSFDVKTGKDKEAKFIDYDLIIKVTDLAGNITESKPRLRFKDIKQDKIKFSIESSQNDKSIYSNKQIVFIDDKIINPDEVRYVFGFTPFDINNVKATFKTESININKIEGSLNSFYIDLSPEVRKNFIVGNNIVDIKENINGQDALIKSITFYSDNEIPRTNVIWPPSYTAFNDNFMVYGMADDDSGVKEIYVGVDATNDSNFIKINSETINNLRNYQVMALNPIARNNQVQQLSEFCQDNQIQVYDKGVLYKHQINTQNLKDGEHFVRFKIIDNAGKVVVRDMAFILDRKVPGVKILNPLTNEKLNGTISIRGDASDDVGVANVLFKLNNKTIIADGYYRWDGLYDLYARNEYDPDNQEPQTIDIEVIAYDYAGNTKIAKQKVVIDTKNDIPKIYINSPAVEAQRFTTEVIKFEGVALDDDGIDSIQYRVDFGLNDLDNPTEDMDENGWRTLYVDPKLKPSWSIMLPKGYLQPGLHTFEVKAYDYGYLQSEVKKITFQIDKENPVINISAPKNGNYLKGLVRVYGKSSDPNEIQQVEVSTNNGWTFVPAEGQENWIYYLDSNSLPDGALKFLVKSTDKAGSQSYSFAIYNIDNTPPELQVLLPKDGMKINNKFKVVGRARDNIALDKGKVKILKGTTNVLTDVDEEGFSPLIGTDAWSYDIDATKWEQGVYTMVVRMYDKAGNYTDRTLSFVVEYKSDLPIVTLDQPQSGQSLTGDFIEFYGTSYDDDGIEAVWISIDGGERIKCEGTTQWKYVIPSVKLANGPHRVVVVSQEKEVDGVPGKFSESISRTFFVEDSGIVVNVNSHNNGDSVGHRPWILGKANYYERDLELKIKSEIQKKRYYQLRKKYKDNPEKLPEIDQIPVSVNEVRSAMNAYLAKNKVDGVYLSIDNGNTYKKNWGTINDWRVRYQTQFLKDGTHMLQFKGVTKSGKETIKYFKTGIDRVKPEVIIDKPLENERINEQLVVKGSADDNNKIEEVKIKFRQFDKNLGKLPKFIEGLYIWLQGWGGPAVSGGLGFSFFDNIVRLEGLFGWFPTQQNLIDIGINIDDPVLFSKDMGWVNERFEPRFSGITGGGKLLARVLDLPFEFFFGEDAKNFSISMEIGAGFYWISGFAFAKSELDGSYYRQKRMTEELLTGITPSSMGYDPQKDSKVLAGFMYQIDFFKVEKYGILRNFALYFENSFYFIASEVESTLTPQIGFGVRNSIIGK